MNQTLVENPTKKAAHEQLKHVFMFKILEAVFYQCGNIFSNHVHFGN